MNLRIININSLIVFTFSSDIAFSISSKPTLTMYCSNNRMNPGAATFQSLAGALKVDKTWEVKAAALGILYFREFCSFSL